MTAVYDNKDFILFPLQQTKTVLKCGLAFYKNCNTSILFWSAAMEKV
jgi:hypothetical protein